MSKTPRTPRAKSSGMRPLGAIRMQQGLPQAAGPTRNDPALHINQLHTNMVQSSVTESPRDAAKEREYQERERKLRDQIAALEKLIAQLRSELKQKTETCHNLQHTITTQAKDYEERLAQSNEEHCKTKEELRISQVAEEEGKKLLQATTEEYQSRIQSIIDEYEKKLKDLRESKDRELKEKDDKMDLLKQRMAASLGKNSQERQQQLEELKRDLIKQAQEARELQQKLKHLQLKKQKCDNCAKLEERLEEKTLQLRLKEKTVNDLQGIGRKMQLQLHQQGAVLDGMENLK